MPLAFLLWRRGIVIRNKERIIIQCDFQILKNEGHESINQMLLGRKKDLVEKNNNFAPDFAA